MNWIVLTEEHQLEEVKKRSQKNPQLIFKHSTRCSTSSLAKHRLERTAHPDNFDYYFLDLIRYRNISNKISDEFKVVHQSPQVLLIHDGKCIYDRSHLAIRMEDIVSAVS